MTDHLLVGMWRLVSMERIDTGGNRIGATVITGLLMYTTAGWMSEALDYEMPGLMRELLARSDKEKSSPR